MSPNDDGVTPVVLLQHMQGMELRLRDEFRSGLKQLEVKVDSLETKVDRHHEEAQRNHVQTMAAIDTIDARLDDIEVVQVPKLKKVVGMR